MAAFRFAFGSMGCPCELKLEADDAAQADAAALAARAEVDRLDAKYSHYRDDSFVARLVAHAGTGTWLALDRETAHLFAFADALHGQSGGLFDPSAGPLTRLWRAPLDRVPAAAAIRAALQRVGWDKLERRDARVRLARAGMALDLGGLVKEYAADRAAAACRSVGIAHGLVDLGGDIAIVGAHGNGSAWQVGIKNPRAPGEAIATIALAHGGLATSGDYERGACIDGRRYSHLVDPRSGWPVESWASVSVAAPDCLIAGGASTLAMLLGTHDGESWLASLGLPYVCAAQDGTLHDRRARDEMFRLSR